MAESKQSTQSNQQSTTNNYAGFQGPALQQAFDAAGTALGQAQGAQAPSGFTAQFSPAMMQAFQNELGYGSGAGSNPVVGATNNASTALSGAGSNGAAAGLFGLGNFTPQGGTQSNINAANAYAGGADVNGMVNNAMLNAKQNFSDIQAPAIMRNAAGTGNINSTAPSVQQGILERGLAQQSADLGSSIRSGLYSSGLNTAESTAANQNQSNLAALLGLTQGGTQAAGTGAAAGAAGVNDATGLFNIANGGASNLNAGNQADLTNQNQAYQFGVNSPFAALNNFYNIVGNKAWGSNSTGSGTSTTTSTPSTLQDIMGGLGMAGSALSGFSGMGGMGGIGNLFTLGNGGLASGIKGIGP